MKSKFIRALTFVLCLAMLIGSMGVFTVTAAGTAEMDITAIFDNGLSYTVPASKYSGDSWNFFYYASVGFDSSLTDKEFKSFTVTWDNGGATGSSEVQMYPQGVASVLYTVIWGVPAPSALVDGATFKIAAGTATNSDTGTTMKLNNDVTMKWNATTQAWEIVPTANYQTGILAVSGNGGGASHIYTVSNDSVPYNGSWAYRYYPYGSYGTMEFIHNGVATPISDGYFQKFSAADYYFNLGSTSASVGDQVRLSGVFACHDFTKQGQGGFYPYIFADVRPITYTYTGSTWTYEVEAVYDQLAFNGFAWSPNVPGADWWDLYLKVDGTIPGEANVTNFANTLTLSVKNSSGVTVLDHATPVLLSYQSHENGTLLFRLPVSALPAASVDVGSLFTVHAGKANSTTVGVNGIEITKDYTIEYTGSGFANYVAYNYTDLSILNFINRAGNGIYFATDNDYPGNWNKYVGLQISLNGGEKIDKYVGNAGPGSKQMVIDLTDAEWATVTAGSTLTIYAGEAKSLDGADYDGDGVADAIRLVETCTFVYNGTAWEIPDTTVYTDMSVESFHDGNTQVKDGTNAHLYLYVTDTMPGEAWEVIDNTAVEWHQIIVINGNEYTASAKKWDGKGLFVEFPISLMNDGDTVTLKPGKYKSNVGGYGYNLTEEYVLQYKNGDFIAYVPYNDVTITGIGGDTNLNVHLYLNTDATMPGEAWGSINDVPVKWDQKITINGTEYTVTAKKAGDQTLFIEFSNSYLTKPGDTIVIKAGTYKSNVGELGYNLTADYTLTYTGTGFVAGAYATTELTFDQFISDTSPKADRWHFYLHTTANIPGSSWGGVFPQVITVDGVETTLDDVKKADGNNWFANIPYSVLPSTGEHTLVIKAG
ncbi:MAG: hypothetical protein IIX68_02500, partial [Clostridia bacterium]|nr:hypothetical protein [Clostridia bacterium]